MVLANKCNQASETQLFCSNCKTGGYVTRQYKSIIYMECPKCTKKWKTLSKVCRSCGKFNGFAVEGLCSACYVNGGLSSK